MWLSGEFDISVFIILVALSSAAIWFGPWARHSAGTATPLSEDSPATGGKIVVPRLITERIEKLRREVAELTEKNRKYVLGPKYGSATADNERRFQRLIEIVDELKSLTDWKKP
jgi:hypothetical protein